MNKKITFRQALLTGIGLVIGSGIFFRASRILEATKGNVGIAILGWLALGLMLAFAGVGLSVLAARSNREGGIVGYMEDIFGSKMSFITGWFSSVVYIPLLTGIMAIVASGFFLDMIGLPRSAMATISLALVFIFLTFYWNYLSTKFAAIFSSVVTIIKMLPIVVIGLIGIFNINGEMITNDISHFDTALFTAPFISMAFAMDGWATVAILSRDMENPKRDIAKVLVLNLFIVVIAYTVYFTGVCMLLDPKEIMALGDEHISVIATNLFGPAGAKLVLFCIVASVWGTLNGEVMGAFRYPYALATTNDLPNSKYFKQINKYGTTGRTGVLSLIITLAWFAFYAIQAFSAEAANGSENYLLSGIAFDDIPIVWMCLIIIILMIGTIKVANKENVGIFKGYIAPIIGIIGQLYIIVSFIQINSAWLLYSIIVTVIIAIGFIFRFYAKREDAKSKVYNNDYHLNNVEFKKY